MEKINAKLNKYRAKLINASDPEKMDMYNLKMQQYMILQNRLIKSGGDYTIFAAQDMSKLTDDTIGRINKTTNVYTVDSVQKFLDKVVSDINNTSNDINKIADDNENLTKQIIDTHRSVINQVNVSEFEGYDKINGALGSFKKYENVVVKYYVDELSNMLNNNNVDYAKEYDIIAFELKLFSSETKQKILDGLKNKNLVIPNVIVDALSNTSNIQAQETQEQQVAQETQEQQVQAPSESPVEVSETATQNSENTINTSEERAIFQPQKPRLQPVMPKLQQMEEVAGGKKRKSKKAYMNKLRRAFERANANLNILDE